MAERGGAIKLAVRSSCIVQGGVGVARAPFLRFRCVIKSAKFSSHQSEISFSFYKDFMIMRHDVPLQVCDYSQPSDYNPTE